MHQSQLKDSRKPHQKMQKIKYCRTCHSSQQNSLIDIFQNNYDKLYNDLTQLPISEDDMYSKFICSSCIKELNHWEDFKTQCMNSLEVYCIEVISVKQKDDIKLEVSEDPITEPELISVLDIKEELLEPAEETSPHTSISKIQRKEKEYQKFVQENPIKKTRKVFNCNYSKCDKNFIRSDRLEAHLRTHINLDKNDDRQVERMSSSKKDVPMKGCHKDVPIIIKNFKCDRKNCRYKTHLDFYLERHIRIRHGISLRSIKCRFCPQIFRKDYRRKLHEETHFSEKKNQKLKVTCDHCGRTYSEKYNLRTHMLRAHIKIIKRKSYSCDLCSKTYRILNCLEKHKEAEHSHFICTICNIKCSSKTELTTHRLEKHETEPAKQINQCDICGKILANAASLRFHKKAHNKEKSFKCKKCDFATNAKVNLVNHVRRIHSTSRPFACDQCQRTYPCESMLNIHKLNHTKDRNVQCPTCNKSFKTDSALHSHKVTHNVHRPFICNVCDMGYKSQYALKKHSVIHKEDREPAQCDLCGKSFASKSSLRSHKSLSHATSRPFECDKCSLNFVAKVQLKNHLKVHSDVRDLNCDVCGVSFKHSGSLSNHMKGHKRNQEDK